MLKRFTAAQTTAVVLFVGLSGIYICLSSGSIAGQGYTGEEIDSGLRMLSVTTAWMKGHPVPPMLWSRHGPLPVLFDLPFLKLGKHIVSPDFMLSFQPGLITAGLVTILFLWLRKLCSPGMSLFLALTAGFGTMLWPYAYISLETKQSFFVLLAGYLALAGGKIERWPRLLLFAAACGLAMSLKMTGIILWPVVAYLIYVQFRDARRERRSQLLVVVLIIGTIWALSHWGTNQFWRTRNASGYLGPWTISTWLQYFVNVIGIFGSPTKGLFVYCPVLLASVVAVHRIFRTNRQLAIFTLLITMCTIGFTSILINPGADGWGPRYLHAAVAPLILCIGAAWPDFSWRRNAVLVPLAVIGVAISFLGAFYYYGQRDFAAKAALQNTVEWMDGDLVWNPITFHARLFRAWLYQSRSGPVLWTPSHTWEWTPPPGGMTWITVDLRAYCQPQSCMVRFWHAPKSGIVGKIFATYLSSLFIGIASLAWVVMRSVTDQRSWAAAEELRTAYRADAEPPRNLESVPDPDYRFLLTAERSSLMKQRERFVRAVYRGLLHREPDEPGIRYWREALASCTPAEVMESFLECKEFKEGSPANLFVPPGHFYSPIVNRVEADEYLAKLESQDLRDRVPEITVDRERMIGVWQELLPLMKSAPFGERSNNGMRYGFENPAYSWGDGSVLHAMIRRSRPRRLIEIGCGWSSACAIDTLETFLPGECEVTLIEPYPELLKEVLGDRATRTRIQVRATRVQDTPTSVFDSLAENDILFIDSTHVLRTGSDVCFELFEILPRLASGVLVHFHDMFWPFEYPRSWVVEENRSWNELYAVRAFLANNSEWKIVMFNDYFAKLEHDLVERTYPAFLKNPGGALWIQKF
jgi:hypothetical protein